MSEASHLELVHNAKVAIDRVNGDTSVSQQTTLESLKEIEEHVGSNITALEDTMEDNES